MMEMLELLELVKLLSFIANPTMFWLLVGLFLGWAVPQPAYAKAFQDKVVALLGSMWKKVKSLV